MCNISSLIVIHVPYYCEILNGKLGAELENLLYYLFDFSVNLKLFQKVKSLSKSENLKKYQKKKNETTNSKRYVQPDVHYCIIYSELFQILKDDAVKVLHSICQQIWKTQQWPQDWKRSVFIPLQRKAMPKNAQTTAQLHSSHTLVK